MAADDTAPGPPKVTVATTMRPGEPIEVTEREAAILRHQGLLVTEETAPVEAPAAKPVQPKGARTEGDTKP